MRFNINQTRDYFNNVSRGFLLAIGLVVIAGLIAATFVYSDPSPSAPTGQDQSTEQSQGAGNGGEGAAVIEDEGSANGAVSTPDDSNNTEGSTATENRPSELAATGPESVAFLVTGLLGALGFGYFHTQSKLKDQLSS